MQFLRAAAAAERAAPSPRLSKPRLQPSPHPAATFPQVPAAKSNIIGVSPKRQDTAAVSRIRRWILRGPHCSGRYVIRSHRANKNGRILHFSGHLEVLPRTRENLSKRTLGFDVLEVKWRRLEVGVWGPSVHRQYSSKEVSELEHRRYSSCLIKTTSATSCAFFTPRV